MEDIAKTNQTNLIKFSQGREGDKLDNILLTIASGTLSLSATFTIQSPKIFVGKNWLFASWIFLTAGLLSILFGYFFALEHFKTLENGLRKDWFKTPKEGERNCWFKLSEKSNSLSFFTVVIGIILFAYFAYLNIP